MKTFWREGSLLSPLTTLICMHLWPEEGIFLPAEAFLIARYIIV
jgi:hypothetical protein